MKQWLAAALGAGLLMAGPALADPRGGYGGGHPPAPPPPPSCCHGGGNTNVNVNVNASTSASAYASAGGYINAHGYDLGGGGYRGGGGVIYTGGGYGGDGGGYYGGGPVYAEMPNGCGAPPSAPFGYAVSGMGRDYRNAPVIRPEAGCPGGGTPPPCQSACGSSSSHGSGGQSYEVYYEERSESGSTWTREDRGGRYGDSRSHEQQDRSGGHHPPAPTDGWVSYGCGCVSSGGSSRPYGYDHAPPHTVPAPHYEPAPQPQPHRPRQEYRQEPGERG